MYRIEGPWLGNVAVSPRPRGGEWLDDEVSAWSQAGVDVVVSLLTHEETRELGLSDEGELCRRHSITFISFSIEDLSVPTSRSDALKLIRRLNLLLAEGHSLLIHCRGGIGRSGLIAASLLVSSGIKPEAALRQASDARGFSVPETAQQIKWVKDFADAATADTH